MRAGTTEPIPDVQITVSNPGVPAGARGEGPTQPLISTVSDAGGRFVFRNVPEGTMVVRAQLQGYFGASVNGTYPPSATLQVVVRTGQIANARVFLIPGGSISGRVLDTNGRVLADTTVQALRATYQDGQLVPQTASSRSTDDRGEFRLFRLPPGQYYLRAIPARTAAPGGRGAAVSASRESPVTTMYPGVTDISTAIPIIVRGGEDSSGLDIRMRTATGITVSGKVASTLPPGPVIRCRTTSFGAAGAVRPSIAELMLQPVELTSVDEVTSSGVIIAKEDGSFEINNVLPGSYELIARLPVTLGWGEQSPPGFSVGSLAFGRSPVVVRSSDVNNVTVVVHAGMDLNGVVIVDGKATPAEVHVALQPDDIATRNGIFASILGQVGAFQPAIATDGTFTIPLVPPAHYRFQIVPGQIPQPLSAPTPCSGQSTRTPQTGLAPMPADTYVADIRQAGVSVYDKGINFGSDPAAPVEVILNTNAGSIEGVVFNSERRPVPRAIVVLVPPTNRRQNPALYKISRSDAQGRFVLTTLPPGPYKLFAWESVQPGAHQNAAFIEKFEARGTGVTVAPGSRTETTVDLIPADFAAP